MRSNSMAPLAKGHTLLHDGRPLVRRRREGASAMAASARELCTWCFQESCKLICSYREHEAISTSCFGPEGAVDVRYYSHSYRIESTKTPS